LLSRSNSVILRFAIAVVLHVVLEHVTWNHTVAFLSKAFWFYTTTRDTTSGGHLGSRRDTGGHATNTVRDREAPGSNPGPPTSF